MEKPFSAFFRSNSVRHDDDDDDESLLACRPPGTWPKGKRATMYIPTRAPGSS